MLYKLRWWCSGYLTWMRVNLLETDIICPLRIVSMFKTNAANTYFKFYVKYNRHDLEIHFIVIFNFQ